MGYGRGRAHPACIAQRQWAAGTWCDRGAQVVRVCAAVRRRPAAHPRREESAEADRLPDAWKLTWASRKPAEGFEPTTRCSKTTVAEINLRAARSGVPLSVPPISALQRLPRLLGSLSERSAKARLRPALNSRQRSAMAPTVSPSVARSRYPRAGRAGQHWR